MLPISRTIASMSKTNRARATYIQCVRIKSVTAHSPGDITEAVPDVVSAPHQAAAPAVVVGFAVSSSELRGEARAGGVLIMK